MTSGREKPQDITYSIKGGKMRIDMPSMQGKGGMIMDTSKREMIMVMDEQKMYMTVALSEDDAKKLAKGDDLKLEKTNETEKILGYTATRYISTSGNETTDLWLAEGIGTFMSFNQSNPMARGRGGQGQAAWERALAGKDLFPLRVVGRQGVRGGKGKDGKGKGGSEGRESFRMEATAIDKQTLPDSIFTPPAGYQKFDMGGMMKGLMQGIGR
jgi:hypothetical protein